ncbi:nucleotidyltransferase family protein [Bordetella sp. FB-8]|uniref:nucleotidyltransferase family protein n=1 Tax=Bordetella sp. FB-8 TaxID=1159870 RepID=UPI00047784C2|nr:nucleotidyltransferase family protein [Bordetella sp. FB-8]
MRALLLCAGLGTRLRPLTDFLPKCLVPINGRPLLDFWIDRLFSQGVDEVLINTHHHASLVANYLARSTWHGRVKLVHEECLLGTGGTLLENRAFFDGQPILLAHADNLTRFDCRDFLSAHQRRPAGTALTMMLFRAAVPSSCGIVEIDSTCVVHAFHEKAPNPPGNLANAAVYLIEPEIIDYMASLGKEVVDFSTEVIPHYIGRISTYMNDIYHRDIGTIASWSEAQRDFSMPPLSVENQQAWSSVIKGLGDDYSRLVASLSENAAG